MGPICRPALSFIKFAELRDIELEEGRRPQIGESRNIGRAVAFELARLAV
jgi:hypothetical protein